MWVVLFHFGGVLERLLPSFSAFDPLSERGYIGVDLFFILSGFIMSYVYSRTAFWDKSAYTSFVVKRFARIYPVHLVTLLALLVMVVACSLMGKQLTGVYSAKDFFLNLTLLNSFPVSVPSWNYPSWSVSAEFFGYLFIFPFAVWFFRSPFLKSQGLVIAFGLMLIHGLLQANSVFGDWVSIAAISFEFLAGAALYNGCKANIWFPELAGKLLPFLILTLILICFLHIPGISQEFISRLIVISCPLLIAGMSTDSGITNRLLGSYPIHYLGVISYSIYMVHALVEKVFKVLFPLGTYEDSGVGVRLLVFTAYLVAPIVLAFLVHRVVEEPSRRKIQALSTRFLQK